jgi:tetratricopeptide (TPR) repeat protein
VPGESAPAKEIHVPPELGARLIRGEITLGELVGLSPSALYAIANLGYQLLTSGKLEQALTIYQGLVAVSPYDSVFHCHLAATLYALGQHDEALFEYSQALNFNKANADALAGRGELYLRMGKVVEAVEDLKRSIELDPEGKRASTLRARATLVMLKEAADRQRAEQMGEEYKPPQRPAAPPPPARTATGEMAAARPPAATRTSTGEIPAAKKPEPAKAAAKPAAKPEPKATAKPAVKAKPATTAAKKPSAKK